MKYTICRFAMSFIITVRENRIEIILSISRESLHGDGDRARAGDKNFLPTCIIEIGWCPRVSCKIDDFVPRNLNLPTKTE